MMASWSHPAVASPSTLIDPTPGARMAADPIASAPTRAAALATLLASARHEASILEHHLESDVHDDEAVLAALRSLAASGGARIRILVQDASRLQVEAPRLLAL